MLLPLVILLECGHKKNHVLTATLKIFTSAALCPSRPFFVTPRTFRETTCKRPQNEIPGVSRSVSHLFAAAGRPTSPLGMMSHAFLFSRERKKGVSSIRSQKWAGTALFARRTSHLRLRQSDSHQKNIFIRFDGRSLSFL